MKINLIKLFTVLVLMLILLGSYLGIMTTREFKVYIQEQEHINANLTYMVNLSRERINTLEDNLNETQSVLDAYYKELKEQYITKEEYIFLCKIMKWWEHHKFFRFISVIS